MIYSNIYIRSDFIRKRDLIEEIKFILNITEKILHISDI